MDRTKRKTCRFCEARVKRIDYRDDRTLRRFMNERGKIIPARVSGVCSKHQRWLSRAIRRGRIMALLPFKPRTFS